MTDNAGCGFHIMVKPCGPLCNLRCKYCFYTEKTALYPACGGPPHMSFEVLESFVRKYIESQPQPVLDFAWQGGEPTLAGLDFFRRAVELQRKYGGGRRINNSLQTNGVLLDDAWCDFLARENFLVGLSMDGPRDIHDAYRVDAAGNGSFERVMAAMERMQEHGVEYNVLAAVTGRSAAEPLRVYRFLRETGTRFVQFIPIVERQPDSRAREWGLRLGVPPAPGRTGEKRGLMPWSVGASDWGAFLVDIFDEWRRQDVGRFFVQFFEVCVGSWMGMDPSLCAYSRRCGNALAMERNGDIYTCDHFVYPDCRLGNIMENQLDDIFRSPRLRVFGDSKQEALPQVCRECRYCFACNGGCLKNRIARTGDGEPGLNILCSGYRRFFRHADPVMREMAALLRAGRPVAEIMSRRGGAREGRAGGRVGRNDPCPCGSGRKHKQCCGK